MTHDSKWNNLGIPWKDMDPNIPYFTPYRYEPVPKQGYGFAALASVSIGDKIVMPAIHLPEIDHVIFNEPATIVFWKDGTKTVVKCQNGDTYDVEKGLMAAMLKRYHGNNNEFNKIINRWISTEHSE